LVGVNNSSEHPTFYRSAQHRLSRLDNGAAYARQDDKRWNDRTVEWTANYRKTVGNHKIHAVAGYSYHDFNGQGFHANNADFPVDGLEEHSMGNGAFLPDGRAGMGSWKNPSVKLAAFFGRVNYSFMDRYLLTASVRRE